MFDHEYDRYQSDSDLERQMHADENKARSDLGYPIPLHRGSNFGPHAFMPFADTDRHGGCVKCGRPKDDPVHTTTTEQAA